MTTAIIVARGGSRRLPNKAMLPFGGGTLISHKVQTLQRCKCVDRIVVGSDSDEILAEAQRVGADTIRRDDYHCDEDRCSANEMIADMVSKVDGDTILWAHPTNPLVRSDTYERAMFEFESRRDESCDSLASVTIIQRHAWVTDACGIFVEGHGADLAGEEDEFHPYNFQPNAKRHQLASYLKPMAVQDGAIFIQPREQMLRNSYFYGCRPLLFPVDVTEGWDIDTRADYSVACKVRAIQE
jgi:CMP-N,N'-diacetyllegionaminic acid synthase